MGRLLDAYDKLQAAPFGSLSARNSDPGLRQMNSQRSTITSALRTGIKKAKEKGDAAGVISNINAANERGLQVTGIGSAEAREAGSDTYADQTKKQADINADLANRAAAGVDKIGGAPQQEITGGAKPATGVTPDESDPTTTAGASFAARATQEAPPRLSLDEQARAKTREKTLAGDFGTGARDKMKRDDAGSLVNTALDAIDQEKPYDTMGAIDKAKSLGGTEKSFTAAIQRADKKRKSLLG